MPVGLREFLVDLLDQFTLFRQVFLAQLFLFLEILPAGFIGGITGVAELFPQPVLAVVPALFPVLPLRLGGAQGLDDLVWIHTTAGYLFNLVDQVLTRACRTPVPPGTELAHAWVDLVQFLLDLVVALPGKAGDLPGDGQGAVGGIFRFLEFFLFQYVGGLLQRFHHFFEIGVAFFYLVVNTGPKLLQAIFQALLERMVCLFLDQ